MASLEDLIDAARAERWDFVDENIAGVAGDANVVAWASGGGLEDADGNVRDLAASILEKSSAELSGPIKDKLRELMGNDENQYVQFRSAFALYVRGERSPDVIAKLDEAGRDPATADIAKGYLSEE